jgi:hypothetical protein
MGLDTVELIVAFEKHFQITIPDREAERISTVGEAAACVTRLKGLSADPARTAVHYAVLQKLLDCIRPDFPAAQGTMVLAAFHHLPTQLTACMGLELPKLPGLQPAAPGLLQKLLSTSGLSPADWSKYTVADLVDWTLAQNYTSLLPTPATLYEVQRAAIGITSYCSGVSVPEIQLTDSFTNDLGMD